jgi:hypothetical protein
MTTTTENTKANVKVVNGIEIPNISFKPAIGESCYVPFPTSKILYGHHIYHSGNESDGHLRDSGLCYPFNDEGRAAAILHAKAMLKYF